VAEPRCTERTRRGLVFPLNRQNIYRSGRSSCDVDPSLMPQGRAISDHTEAIAHVWRAGLPPSTTSAVRD
jgi:hypothetical protein